MTTDSSSPPFVETAAQGAEAQGSAETPLPSGPSWLDQDETLRLLWNDNKTPEAIADELGRSVAAIMTRAARLGLPRRSAPGRKRGYKRTDAPRRIVTKAPRVKVVVPTDLGGGDTYAPPQISMRVCLMCLNKFQSLGRFNRICQSCKGSAEYATGSSTPDFTFRVTS
ncbi:MAG: hypothetical protein WC612_01405 [Bdellovibrionales bacterium]|jgi:hypothetical protein